MKTFKLKKGSNPESEFIRRRYEILWVNEESKNFVGRK